MGSSILKRGSFEKILCAASSGIYVNDRSGRRFLDSCSGAVASLGYSNEAVIEATINQLKEVPFSHTGTFTSEASEKLADLLVTQSKGRLSRVVFSPSGTEAIEVAIKMAAQYWKLNGFGKKEIVLCRELSYHGGSLKTLEVGGQLSRKKYFCDKKSGHSENIKICNSYRNVDTFETTTEYIDYCINSLEKEIERLGAEKISCFLIETVGGSTSGAVTAEKDYFEKTAKVCKKYNILLVLDEVMCGLGRTGHYYAFEAENIQPDIVAVGKTIASGYQPLAATLCSQRVAVCIEQMKSGFIHAGTYVGHNVSCAAGYAAQKYVLENDLVSRVKNNGAYLTSILKEELNSCGIVGDIRGRGFLQSIEFVSNKSDKTPFSKNINMPDVIKNIGMENEILLYACEGFSGKGTSDHILIAPPYICTIEELNIMAERIVKTIKTAENLLYKPEARIPTIV
ncbi:MAG: aminotransferase class III-fold pyridoxal phosphate-dependent enzyme [Reinekea sp.]